MVAGAGLAVRNLPSMAKASEAVQGDVRQGARASVKRVAVLMFWKIHALR